MTTPSTSGPRPGKPDPPKPLGQAHFDESPAERQGRPIPIDESELWSQAMRCYLRARDLGISRLEASEVFKSLQHHPSLSVSAQIMLDLAKKFPD